MALVGDGKRAGHAGDTAAHHQGGFVDRQVKFLQGLQATGPGHRHADNILAFWVASSFCLEWTQEQCSRILAMSQIVLIQSRLPKGVPEQRFQGSGGTGGNDHPIEPFFLGQIRNFLGGVGGT
jgi:hypothetical protein